MIITQGRLVKTIDYQEPTMTQLLGQVRSTTVVRPAKAFVHGRTEYQKD